MPAYSIDPLAYARALSLVLIDSRQRTDALFIHGSPAISDEIDMEMLYLGRSMLDVGEVGTLVINGLSDEAARPNGNRVAYPGSDTWEKWLQEIGVSNYQMLPPSHHTAAESDNLIKMAQEKAWKSVTIASYPHHILRCMLQMVFCLKRAGSDLKVYTRTISEVNWQMIVKKHVLGGEPFVGSLVDAHTREEYDRVIRYADTDCYQSPEGVMVSEEVATANGISNYKRKYTPHATLEELIEYFAQRDA